MAPLENVWGMQKAYMSKFTHRDVEETRELVLEAWYEGVSQNAMNRPVDSMPERLQAVIDMEGKVAGC